jgi:hypothetical protein
MKQSTVLYLLFNFLGVLVGLVVVGYVLYAALHTEQEPPCSARYPAPTRFALKASDGTLLSPIELQALSGPNEWGVIDNAKVVPADVPPDKAPGGAALEVKLASVAVNEPASDRATNGVDFRWTPPGVQPATAACLSYSLWLPKDFAFNSGGVLPGIFGDLPAAMAEPASDATRFGSRPQWRSGVEAKLAIAAAGAGYRPVSVPGFPLPQGRWTRVEQELVLNAPGTANGTVRLWVDGQLKAEDTGLALRTDPNAKISGVLADIGYFRNSGKTSILRLSAFELSWR